MVITQDVADEEVGAGLEPAPTEPTPRQTGNAGRNTLCLMNDVRSVHIVCESCASLPDNEYAVSSDYPFR